MQNIEKLPSLEIKPGMKDLTNCRQGKITFLKPSQRKNGRIYWWTICDCGNIQELRADTKSQSCKNCRYKEQTKKTIGKPKKDLINQKFGKLMVLYPTQDNNGRLIWHCKCDCGKECDVSTTNLTTGHTKSCGCLRKEEAHKTGLKNLIDLTGQTFGYLTVLKDSKERRGKDVLWECQCVCGKIVKVATNDLKIGSTKSCGCKKQDLNSQTRINKMIGQKFGKLTVLAWDETKNIDNSYNYICKCECGNLKIANGVDLRNGSVASCGCLTKSLGEQNIRKILKDNNIPFESEKTFNDCIFPDTKKAARYDFYINNRLIEYDGRQHFEGWRWGGNSIQDQLDSLNKIRQHDQFKNKYALEHNIPLVRIPYTQRDNITLDMLLGDQYLVKGDA